MMSLTFGLFTQVRGSGPLGPLVLTWYCKDHFIINNNTEFRVYQEMISIHKKFSPVLLTFKVVGKFKWVCRIDRHFL